MDRDQDERYVQRPGIALAPPGLVARADAFLESRSPVLRWAICVATFGIVFASDVLTGPGLSWSIFYLLPVGLCAWYLGWQRSVAVAIAAGIGWYLAGLAAGQRYESAAAHLWNPIATTLMFLLVACTLILLRETLRHEQELARTDGLTGVANSRSFLELAGRELARAQRRQLPITMAYLDVDRLKDVNDSRGHATGDAILREIAAALRSAVREVDVVARLGGDEFAVLLPDVDGAGAPHVVDRVFERLAGVAEAHACDIGFSIGVVTFVPPLPLLDDMIRTADDVMYTVKRSGGGRVLCVDAPPPSTTRPTGNARSRTARARARG
jgi:diguanylate cyclase (GGDEF)-like protein